MARPRDPDIDQRVLDAARQLLADAGEHAVTMAAVAERAGVSRPALYRRWPSRAVLLFALHTSASVPPEMPDLGSLRAELVLAVDHLVATMAAADADLVAEQFASMIRDDTFAEEVWTHRWRPDRDRVLTLWWRAVDRGEVRADVDGAAVIDDLVASCLFRVHLAHRPPASDEVRALVDRVLDGVGADRAPAQVGQQGATSRRRTTQPSP